MSGLWANMSATAANMTSMAQAQTSDNSTFAVISQLKTSSSRSVRTSTIVLASFNILAALLTAYQIYRGAYVRLKREKAKGSNSILSCVRESDTFPFILALGIIVQGVIFIVAQSQGLGGLFASGCSTLAQFIWPALFITPYTQLVFAVEMSVRGLRSQPFSPRGKWDLSICLAVLITILLATGLVATIQRSTDTCFASLLWIVAEYSQAAFALLSIVAVILMVCCAIVFSKISKNTTLGIEERIEASQMVYCVVVGIISLLLMIPFFVYLTFARLRDQDGTTGITLGMIATVVTNISGMILASLRLYFGSKNASLIGSNDRCSQYDDQQLDRKIVIHLEQSPSDFHNKNRDFAMRSWARNSDENLVDYGKEEANIESPIYVLEPSRKYFDQTDPTQTTIPNPISIPQRQSARSSWLPSTSLPRRSPGLPHPRVDTSYSGEQTILPSTTYSPSTDLEPTMPSFGKEDFTLMPPPRIVEPGLRHRRDSSMVSMATVQIGLRLSNVNDMALMSNSNREPSFNTPKPSPAFRPNLSPLVIKISGDDEVSPVSPLPSQTTLDPPSPQEAPPPLNIIKRPTATLPKAPRLETVQAVVKAEDETLSPTVYSPTGTPRVKTVSPKGVGFQVPQRGKSQRGYL